MNNVVGQTCHYISNITIAVYSYLANPVDSVDYMIFVNNTNIQLKISMYLHLGFFLFRYTKVLNAI